ncbi:hypothetical protein OHB54_16730 [Streptomyces sp. NBC_01007]|nr:hypothetical protein OHB54_16730 [Streptomyces sp. NBC_01007]
MQNPFTIPDRSGADGRPLCPWETSEHENFYAPVDHAPEAFSNFKAHLTGHHDFRKSGKVILITGPGGSGKTSLMHRCASFAKKFLASLTSPQPVGIVDLTADNGSGLNVGARVRLICSRLNDELRFQRIFEDADFDELEKRAEEPPKFFPYLSRLLQDTGKVIIILLPPSEIADEVYAYNGYAQGMIIFFCESSYAAVADIDAKPAGLKPILHLEVDVLDEIDGWKFVEHRLKLASLGGENFPAVSEGAIRLFMQARIRGRGKTTVRELQMTCESVFETAVDSSKTQVAYADFTQYYTEKASLS